MNNFPIRMSTETQEQSRALNLKLKTSSPSVDSLDFQLPPELEASVPPETRGLSRDQVRLMVTYRSSAQNVHTQFRNLPDFLEPGDVLAINTSGTLNAAVLAVTEGGEELELHVSTHLPADVWAVELRRPSPNGTLPYLTAQPGERLRLPGEAEAQLLAPYRLDQRPKEGEKAGEVRLWLASLNLPAPATEYLQEHGFPIRYKYVHQEWPNQYYQTVYADEMGSAEMPSAGRAFTRNLLERLKAKGVQVAPLLLHTGVASLESHEPPYEEYYRVPPETARLVNQAKSEGKRVIAVGTTVVRTLETVAYPEGQVHPGEGWTSLVITPERGLYVVDGLLTGFHEPRSSHLMMLEAFVKRPQLKAAYMEALKEGYLWHEFGDLNLILP